MLPSWDQYCANPETAGAFENLILYRMCRDHPLHNDPYVIAGKIVAIGRIYAASPERGSGGAKDGNPAFFDAIGAYLAKSELDEKIFAISFDQRFSSDIQSQVVDVHSYLVGQMVDFTEVWSKRGSEDNWKPRRHQSFASKYLHFHRPNAFPIMDSFAKAGLNCVGKKGVFDTYQAFCDGFAEHVMERDEPWTPRSLDDVLLGRGRIHADDRSEVCRQCGTRRRT